MSDMIENYTVDEYGIIQQVQYEKFVYDVAYIKRSYTNRLTQEKLDALAHLRLAHLLSVLPVVPQSIVDVGYGEGSFLRACESVILKRFGHDVFPDFIPPRCEFVRDLADAPFVDVVSFFDSLEHLENREIMRDIRCTYVYISVPWCHYFSDEWFDTWHHKKPNEHLSHFNEKSLAKFMASCGFSLVNFCAVEDSIRKGSGDYPNILTALFKSSLI
jgi:hypothetical protein